MALQEAAVTDYHIHHVYAQDDLEIGYYLSTREAENFLVMKDVRDTAWFFTDNEPYFYRMDEEGEYVAGRDPATSFPTPKLGAKTRPC